METVRDKHGGSILELLCPLLVRLIFPKIFHNDVI